MARPFADYLLPIFWLVFLVVWLVYAQSSKRTIYTKDMGKGIAIRFGILIVLIIIVVAGGGTAQTLAQPFTFATNPIVSVISIVLVALGIAFAIWARVYLGKNWGMPMSIKENPELVTTGPYKYVRHPIYTGMLVALIGSALSTDLIWLIIFVSAAGYFIYSATREEKILVKEFGERYTEYKKHSKMLIPFVL